METRMKLLYTLALGLLLVPVNFGWADSSSETPTDTQRIQKLEEELKDLKENLKDPEGKVEVTSASVKKMEKIKPEGYLQFRYNWTEEESDSDPDRFDLRRVRLGIKAKPSADLEAKVQADFAGGKTELKDAWLKWSPFGSPLIGPSLTVGQQKWPFGHEVVQSSSVRETPERALAWRTLFSGERDLGIKLSGKEGLPCTWEVGVFNGTGANKSDNNNEKDFVGRLGLAVSERLDVGGSFYLGRARTGEKESKKNRLGADLRLQLADGVVLKGEYVTAKELGFEPWGYLGQLNLNVNPNQVLVVKYDYFDDDGLLKRGKVETWNVGVVHHINSNLKGKLFWSREEEKDGVILEFLTIF
jgi:hypothetical protein